MAKELPYFKFYCSEWNDGDITLEGYEIQGLYINICSWYWSRECNITIDQIKKKFSSEADVIDYLCKTNLLKVKNGKLSISFLDEQMKDRKKLLKRNRENGLKGGRPKTQSVNSGLAKNNPKLTNIEEKRREEKEKTIQKRIEDFMSQVNEEWHRLGGGSYLPSQEVSNFIGYWTEHGPNDKKMRFEKEKSFGISRRLATWKRNYEKNNKKFDYSRQPKPGVPYV